MVYVTVSETYDLSTKANKMTLIGIHTPSKDIIQKTYPGLCMNSKFCRIVKQDVQLACASVLPAAVNEVGYGVDDVAPEDLFNPILYKAVSNESMSTLEARLAGLLFDGGNTSLKGPSVVAEDENVTGLTDEFNVYYSLLSNRDGFKTANPQQGLAMKGLVPLVFERYYNFGTNQKDDRTISVQGPVTIAEDAMSHDLRLATYPIQSMRGHAHPMPKFNTTYVTTPSGPGTGATRNGMTDDGTPWNCQNQMPDILPVYTAAILMPPSRLHKLFYRMVVRTTIEFSEVRPITEITSFAQMSSAYADVVYHSDYAEQSQTMTSKLGMVDVKDADIQKIMEGA